MKIYVAHSRKFDFKKELYEPIRQSSLNDEHTFVLPHENSDESFNSKDFLKNESDLMIAEVSYPETGLGIELGWADSLSVPIICIYRKGTEISNSLKTITKNFVEYSDKKEMISKIEKIIKQICV